MIKTEAQRIAAAVNIIRPEWPTGLLMTVLGDTRMVNRPYADAMIALVACALDSKVEKPGRVHNDGNWWAAVTASRPVGVKYKTITDADCAICSRPEHEHPLLTDNHVWEPQHARTESHKPTPEQRAAIDAAVIEAQKVATAEREAKAARVVADVDEVLSRHASDIETEEVA